MKTTFAVCTAGGSGGPSRAVGAAPRPRVALPPRGAAVRCAATALAAALARRVALVGGLSGALNQDAHVLGGPDAGQGNVKLAVVRQIQARLGERRSLRFVDSHGVCGAQRKLAAAHVEGQVQHTYVPYGCRLALRTAAYKAAGALGAPQGGGAWGVRTLQQLARALRVARQGLGAPPFASGARCDGIDRGCKGQDSQQQRGTEEIRSARLKGPGYA